MSKGPAVGIFRQAAGAWIVLIVAWGVVAVGGLFWLAGGIANWFTGHGLSGPAFDFQFGRNLFDKGPSRLWPDTPVILIAVVFGLELVTIGIPVAILVVNASRRQLGGGDPIGSLARDHHLEHLTPAGVRRRAVALRPDLADAVKSGRRRRTIDLRDAGVALGSLRPSGTVLRASWEDVAVAIMAPRSGKTTAAAIPAILEAPGAALVTSNKADVWAATWEIRARETDEGVWVFDPQGITHMPQSWWWNPLKGVKSFDAALRLASHFMQEVEQSEGGDEAFWVSAAEDLLTGLLLAAGLKEVGITKSEKAAEEGRRLAHEAQRAADDANTAARAAQAAAAQDKGDPAAAAVAADAQTAADAADRAAKKAHDRYRTLDSNVIRIKSDEFKQGSLHDIYVWLSDPGDDLPVRILEASFGEKDPTAAGLRSRMTSAEETREGIFEYARTACRCLRNPDIMRWVIPPYVPLQGILDESDTMRSMGLREIGGDLEFDAVGFANTRQTMYLLSKDGAAAAAPLVAALTDRIMIEATREAERRYRGRLDPPMVVVLDEAANICKIADLPALYSHLGSRGIFVLTILQSRPQARQVWGKDGFDTMWSAATVKIVGAGIDDPELADDISRLVGDHDISVRSVSTGAGGSYSESTSLRKEAIMSPSAVRAMPKGTAILLVTGAVPASIKLLPWFEGPRAEEIKMATRYAQERMAEMAQPVAQELVTVNGGRGIGTTVTVNRRQDRGTPVDLRKSPPPAKRPTPAPWPEKTAEQSPILVAEQPPPSAGGAPPDIPEPATVPRGGATSSPATEPAPREATVISQDGAPLGTIEADATQRVDLGTPTGKRSIRKPRRWLKR